MIEEIGKFLANRRYVHISVLQLLDSTTSDALSAAAALAGVEPERDFNVVRLDGTDSSIALLSYPAFFDEAFPRLARSWKVRMQDSHVTLRTYEDSFNPPVLHRKELLLADDDPHRPGYERLTAELESQGFFEDSARIGFKLQWERLLVERGFKVIDHQLVPIGNEEGVPEASLDDSEPPEIARHLTALSRQNFSAPIQILQRFGFFDGVRTLFDYGCGKCDDLRGLAANGIVASGWDPHYASSSPITAAQIVNLGFVINVIEDPVERRDALRRAYSLAEELLVVSTMLLTDNPGKVTLYGDGVLTSRRTFQKYYTQSELRDYIASTLGEEPIPVAPGVFFVFKDKEVEQRFQVGRYRSRIRVHPPSRSPRPFPFERIRRVREVAPDKYEVHRELLDPLWARCLDLGREPDPQEVENLEAIESALGSLRKALKLTLSRQSPAFLERARKQRTDDLMVYLALLQFQKRKPYKQLESRLQRDIRAFFGDFTSAQEHARQLLYQVAKPDVLSAACERASEEGLGWLEPNHSLQLHSSLVSRLPAPLRVYVGCAAILYGDPTESDLVKVHIRSGKVTFMKFDDFFGSPLPRMMERTKINLRTLDLRLFWYTGEFAPPLLYEKSRYINEELPRYAEQLAFDQVLQGLGVADFSGYGPTEPEFTKALRQNRWKVEGFRLERADFAPNLDDQCGKYLTYRQLIECGETQAATALPNLPKNPASYTALYELATRILDPVIEYFGGIELTYGFCSSELATRISGRIAPTLDQHAACEWNRRKAPTCSRLGAAVDFLVRDVDMKEVAEWMIANLPFDRLYFYESDRPLHVSYGPEGKREAFEMRLIANNRRMPHQLTPRTFRAADKAGEDKP